MIQFLDAKTQVHLYLYYLGNGMYLDASNNEDCLARRINHSCSPNAIFQNRIITDKKGKKETRVIVLAKEDIKADEHIFIDYNYGPGSIFTKCLCGAKVIWEKQKNLLSS